jgi:hypothetical protein
MTTQWRLYDTYGDATEAVRRLEQAGIPQGEITIIGHGDVARPQSDRSATLTGTAAGSGIGGVVGGGAGLMAAAGMLAIPGIGPVVAAGWLATTLAGIVAGAAAGGMVGGVAGGIVDVLTASGVDREDANLYAEAMRRGATLVSVRAGAAEDAEVRRLLESSRAVDVVERRRAYEETGWSFFDPTAIDYKATVEADARRREG